MHEVQLNTTTLTACYTPATTNNLKHTRLPTTCGGRSYGPLCDNLCGWVTYLLASTWQRCTAVCTTSPAHVYSPWMQICTQLNKVKR